MPVGLGLVLCIAAFWTLLHAFAYRTHTRQRRLPGASADKLTASFQSACFPGLESTLGPPLCLRFSYTPPAARSLAARPRRRPVVLRRWAKDCYSLGAWVVVVAFLCLPILFVNSLYRGIHPPAHAASGPVLDSHVRWRSRYCCIRACKSDTFAARQAAGKTLLVPGITLPLSEAPVMLLAGFISMVWHEAGHAVAASL
jgi:hypothetical protein